MSKTTAIIVAAGSSTRMGEYGDKIFADLCGKSVLQYSLEAFAAAESIDDIIVVTRAENFDKIHGFRVVEGGETRAESVRNGLYAIKHESGIVAIHDGARPLISPELIDRVVANCPAIPVIPVKDTIKQTQNGFVKNTPSRETLYAAQTPQVFDLAMYRQAVGNGTDDSEIMERMGVKVKIVEGDERNIKITTKQDLRIAEVLLRELN